MLTLGRPSPARLQAALDRARGQEVTYPEVGATAGDLPARSLRLRREVALGRGDAVFARAALGVRGWQLQERAGLLVRAEAPTADLGTTVTLAVPLGPLWRLASCRVVRVVEEADDGVRRQGFAYGTLPGHPESGEEAFVVEQDAAGDVVLRLAVFSRLATWDARALPPAARAVQLLLTARYLRAARALAAGA